MKKWRLHLILSIKMESNIMEHIKQTLFIKQAKFDSSHDGLYIQILLS